MSRGFGLKSRIAAVTAITGFLVLAGTGAGWAYWSSQANVQVQTASADLTLDATGFDSLAKTFTNDSLSHTGSVSVKNTTTTTSTQKGAVTLTFSATGQSTSFLQNFAILVWQSTTANPCTASATPGTSLLSSNWGSTSSYTTPAASGFSAGETRTYCVRTTVATRESVATTAGSVTFTPRISGSIAVGSFTGTDAETTTQATGYIYTPSTITTSTSTYYWVRPNLSSTDYSTYCADVNGGSPGSGTTVISYGCKTSGAENQVWRFTGISGRTGYYTITTRANTNYLIDGSSGTLRTQTSSGATSQAWHLQHVSGSIYQIVNDASGLCWTSPIGSGINLGDITLASCSSSAQQQFVMSRAVSSVSCTYSGGNFSVSLTAAPSTPYSVLADGTTRDTETTNASGTTTLSFSRTSASSGTHDLEVYDENGTRVAFGSYTRSTFSSSTNSNSCSIGDMM
ncbi:RICIN domain-containing protein [Homoserinibacter sp. GY 40078]|uniref:RICIN domain-containing protein n=1 Tax=Homoserinibacter sp. GY 40078 TaxID=2603275 RepID=UPI0011CAFCDF|nr:RICIN domain-containing protein [Homoserinibacter sp. GY 40078]TXK17068.1 RICIN domain-containing protein [Homoserinibacter sp. GY 40078]